MSAYSSRFAGAKKKRYRTTVCTSTVAKQGSRYDSVPVEVGQGTSRQPVERFAVRVSLFTRPRRGWCLPSLDREDRPRGLGWREIPVATEYRTL